MKIILLQLPIPRLNFGLKTGNVPLAGACLSQACENISPCTVLPEEAVSYSGDQALIEAVSAKAPDAVGFTIFAWNMDRSIYLAQKIKEKTGAVIIFGGPQITDETIKDIPPSIDFMIMGEGEALFKSLVKTIIKGSHNRLPRILKPPQEKTPTLLGSGSPYLSGHLDLGPGNVMLLETQRGCPYKCGFCYYSKARKKPDIADDARVIEAIDWAMENRVEEIYLMDPSFNARPRLSHLLEKIAGLNASSQIPIISEIRAESITRKMAVKYAEAGFTQFEVGLQTTTPKALSIMNRPTNIDRFLNGIEQLKREGITPVIDLIFGLPGDTPQGFRTTIDFVLENQMDEHVQAFPLLVLPGTAFRRESQKLGLDYAPYPPYPVIQTPDFSRREMGAALDLAEQAFDRTFFPFPDLDIGYVSQAPNDHYIEIKGEKLLAKLILDTRRSLEEISSLAGKITSPFQIFFKGPALDLSYMEKVTQIVSEANPFVPLELVFIDPESPPDTRCLTGASAHKRPHFLDLDQHFLYPEPGSRSILFTLVSSQESFVFTGPMERQVYLWGHPHLPGLSALDELAHMDGILIPGNGPSIISWQETIALLHEDILPVSFGDIPLQARWMGLTEKDKYHLPLFNSPGLS